MHFLPLLLALASIGSVVYFTIRKIYPELVRKKAIKQLEKILFPEGNRQKSRIIKTCQDLTGRRFADEDLLDYFIKIKGLHTVKINSETNFWVRKYLFTPTSIKLNYFEQVKFCETFLNFPASGGHNREMLLKNGDETRINTKPSHAKAMSQNTV